MNMQKKFNITFNPGPSSISNETYKDMIHATETQILEISHRSSQFTDISKKCIEELRKFLNIPDEYMVFYTASATEAMALSIANTVESESFHFINGAFSQKFHDISIQYNKNVSFDAVKWGEINHFSQVTVPQTAEVITLPINETSTGVMMNEKEIQIIKKNNPDKIIIGDITSIAGGKKINLSLADIWLFSIQKCFGLPSGLGICIVSPRAYQKSLQLEKAGKNIAGHSSFSQLQKPMEKKFQTLQTPNVLGIYLLGQQCERWNKRGGIETIEKESIEKQQFILEWIKTDSRFDIFSTADHISQNVLCISGTPENILQAHKNASQSNIILGDGYGEIKETTFRIANFPNIHLSDIKNLLQII